MHAQTKRKTQKHEQPQRQQQHYEQQQQQQPKKLQQKHKKGDELGVQSIMKKMEKMTNAAKREDADDDDDADVGADGEDGQEDYDGDGKDEGPDDDADEIPLPELDAEQYSNVYHEVWKQMTAKMPKDMNRIFDPKIDDERRATLLNYLNLTAAEKYAWAVPDERAIRILCDYAPVVEIGAGRGYWGSMLLKRGKVYDGYDITPWNRKGEKYPAWCEIKQGSANVLAAPENHKKTLFLCYPDDFQSENTKSLALACLKKYRGDTIIHVGEMLGQTVLENPWGKSTDADFQQQLAASFHKVLQVPLPSWPGAMDTLSVWKRTEVCQIDDMIAKHIPPSEQLSLTLSCPKTQHLVSIK